MLLSDDNKIKEISQQVFIILEVELGGMSFFKNGTVLRKLPQHH